MSEGAGGYCAYDIFREIIFIPWQAGQIIREWSRINEVRVTCSQCGLMFHDRDATYCKACGHIIYQEYDSPE